MPDFEVCEVLAYFLSDAFAEPGCPLLPNHGERNVNPKQVLETLQSYEGPNEKIQFFASLDVNLFRRVYVEWDALKSCKD